MKSFHITVLDGDGIGPEVTAAAVRVLEAAADKFGFGMEFEHALLGGCAIDACGTPLPEETVRKCRASDAVLLGAVGGPRWEGLPGEQRPEKGLLGIRKALELYANIRPARLFPALKEACPLRPELAEKGIDLVVVRELTGGIYFGQRGRDDTGAYDTERYSVSEIERIARTAFEYARLRRRHVTSIDKANVLETSRLWRETVHRVAKEYPDITLEDMLVDNAAMQLVKAPGRFDVILCSNLFGDILSDEAAELTGSIGILPSESRGGGKPALYEPIHGSAPDIAGQGLANPIATILSAAMMLRSSLDQPQAADAVETAVERTLEEGLRTRDLAAEGQPFLTTAQMTERILAELNAV